MCPHCNELIEIEIDEDNETTCICALCSAMGSVCQCHLCKIEDCIENDSGICKLRRQK
jgi:hypothetical protein